MKTSTIVLIVAVLAAVGVFVFWLMSRPNPRALASGGVSSPASGIGNTISTVFRNVGDAAGAIAGQAEADAQQREAESQAAALAVP